MGEISRDKFIIVGCDEENSETTFRKNLTYWQKAWVKFLKNKGAIICIAILAIIILMAVIGPNLTKYKFDEVKKSISNRPPSSEHWFGTDYMGRDIFARLWMGARGSLTIGFIVSFVNITIGVIFGSICGYFGGLVDDVITRIMEILMSLPNVLIIMLINLILGPGIFSIVISMSMIGWCYVARIVRGQILQVKEQEYVLAAQALGANSARIISKHLMSNIIGIAVVTITLEIPNTILNETVLTYIGFASAGKYLTWGGVSTSLGAMLLVFPYQVYIPSSIICLTLVCFNIVGDALADALDPRLD